MQVSYRRIAKLLIQGMPLDGQEYGAKVESYIQSIEAMPLEQQATLQASYIFSRKVQPEERQDTFQELVAHILDTLARHSIPSAEVELFCYAIAKRRWIDFIDKESRHKRILEGGFISLNKRVSTNNGGTCDEVELQELIAGEVEFECKLNSELDSQAVLDTLPDRVKAIVVKRLDRDKLSASERNILNRHITKDGQKIREALAV